ncbi:MAG TPA: Wzz/FepE/Etk N-terminal domain-containing protein, partial [Candidatus Bathyarchaeia archaeon]|nr:Wzz/FepE/Etk N-terminal domain-containing protein [Candidatus Bathyarchaeia archaeon]
TASPGVNLPVSLQVLWERRKLLYRVTVWAALISSIIVFLIPSKFDSTVRIMPPDSQTDTVAMVAALAGKTAPGLGSLAGNLLGMKNTGALFVHLLRSRTVQDHIVDRFNLQTVYWEHYKQDARKTLDERTDILEDRKSGVISVTVRDRDRQRAHDIAQAYIEELDGLVSRVSTSSARRERIFIEQRLSAVEKDLEDAEQKFSSFASKNTALDIKEQTRAMVESAAVLQGQMIAARSELQSLEQIYTDNNVRVRLLRGRVNELERQLQKLGGEGASLSSEATKSEELYPSIRKLPLLGVQWADLYRRVKIQETVSELLNQQYELARIQEAKEIPVVRVIDPASVPEKKSFPPRLAIITLLTSLCVAAAAAGVIGSTRWDRLNPHAPMQFLVSNAMAKAATQLRGRAERFVRPKEVSGA